MPKITPKNLQQHKSKFTCQKPTYKYHPDPYIIMESWQLKQRQSLPLDVKINLSILRIRQWYEHYDGQVYVAFSGGKDSTVLLHLVRSQYPNIPAVFADTGLEYPEIRNFVKTIPNVVWLKPKKNFKQIITEHGYPIISKSVSRYVNDLQNETNKNKNVCNLRRTGYNRRNIYCPSYKLPEKWKFLVDAPFKISDKCCHYMKKEPLDTYAKQTKSFPYIGILACESYRRTSDYLKQGCNSYNTKTPHSMPLSFWLEQDILQYIQLHSLSYAPIYGQLQTNPDSTLQFTGEQRTGCMFCAFGAHLEKEPNRFQRMKLTHPSQYKFCMENLGLDAVLTYTGTPH